MFYKIFIYLFFITKNGFIIIYNSYFMLYYIIIIIQGNFVS